MTIAEYEYATTKGRRGLTNRRRPKFVRNIFAATKHSLPGALASAGVIQC
jgi:hypothetical protein